MKKTYVPARLALLTALALTVFFAGCARSPVPPSRNPVAYTQEKVQAADHWRTIAVDAAEKIRDALVERTDLTTKPLYIEPPDSRPFTLSFYQLLRTELVSRAVQVSEEREDDTVLVAFDALTVTHDPSRSRGGIHSVSDNEILVNVRMSHNNRYVVHRSYTRYINDPDRALYLNSGSLNPASGRSRTVRVINR